MVREICERSVRSELMFCASSRERCCVACCMNLRKGGQSSDWLLCSGHEGVAAGTDLVQCAKDGSHLCIDKVKRCRVCEAVCVWIVLDQYWVDLGARLSFVCGRDKSFNPWFEGRVLTLNCSGSMGHSNSFRGNKETSWTTVAPPTKILCEL